MLIIRQCMNRLAQELAEREGLLTFKQACEKYETTKDKLRDLISSKLLSFKTSELDRRIKLLSKRELDDLLRSKPKRNGKTRSLQS